MNFLKDKKDGSNKDESDADINFNKKNAHPTSPFKVGKLPTKTIRVRIPYYKKIRKYAFIKDCPKASVIDKIMQYGMHDYERLRGFGKYHK